MNVLKKSYEGARHGQLCIMGVHGYTFVLKDRINGNTPMIPKQFVHLKY